MIFIYALRCRLPCGSLVFQPHAILHYSYSGILEKLKEIHPLPMLILEWRKVNNALTKVVHPMQRAKELCFDTKLYRIFPHCQFHTVTGRVIIAEPGLQNVPKDFDINLTTEDCISAHAVRHGSEQELATTAYVSLNSRVARTTSKVLPPVASDKLSSYGVSMRTAFIPSAGGILIAADYSQLELRIITHLSKDRRLLSILNNDGDVFRMIAAEINQCSADHVTEQQRQHTKAICYGIIYGIGAKSLAEKLEVSEDAASVFMEKFKNRFSGIKDFVQRAIEFVRSKGYVITMNGRRRYFSTINARSLHARGQAERQAVNTIVQGSAADLVKNAMINIDREIDCEFPIGKDDRSHKLHDLRAKRHLNDKTDRCYQRPKLVLQLHDELMYECHLCDKEKLIEIIKREMEQAMKLVVRLPVKVKAGNSWGEMEDCTFNGKKK